MGSMIKSGINSIAGIAVIAIILVLAGSFVVTIDNNKPDDNNQTVDNDHPPENQASSLNLLEVTLDKETYNYGENMTITLKNNSDIVLNFPNSSFGIFFQKWENENWVFYGSIPGRENVNSIYPGENAQVVYTIGMYGYFDAEGLYLDFSEGGRYRVMTYGGDENYCVYPGYAEFTVNV
jgi:hypothetical protein